MKKKLLIQGKIRYFFSIHTIRKKYGNRIARVCKPFCLEYKRGRYLPVELGRLLHKYRKMLGTGKKGIREKYLLERLKEELFYATDRWAKRFASPVQSENGDERETTSP